MKKLFIIFLVTAVTQVSLGKSYAHLSKLPYSHIRHTCLTTEPAIFDFLKGDIELQCDLLDNLLKNGNGEVNSKRIYEAIDKILKYSNNGIKRKEHKEFLAYIEKQRQG